MIFVKIYELASKIALLVSDTLCSTSPCVPLVLTAIPINASRHELKKFKIFVMISLEIPYLYYYRLASRKYSSCAVVIAKLVTCMVW